MQQAQIPAVPEDTIRSAKEIVRLVGLGLGNLMCRIYEGDIMYRIGDIEAGSDRDSVRGTIVYLLGGSIGRPKAGFRNAAWRCAMRGKSWRV